MSNYNSQLQSNNADLQAVLEVLQNKAAGSSGETSSTLFGSYIVHSESNAITSNAEIVFDGSVKTYFLREGQDGIYYCDVHKMVFDIDDESVTFFPMESEVFAKRYKLNENSHDWVTLDENYNVYGYLMDGWESIIDFIEPIELSQSNYATLMSILFLSSSQTPYKKGYESGYGDCESEMDITSSILDDAGFEPLFIRNETPYPIYVNGFNELVVAHINGNTISFFAECDGEQMSSIYAYGEYIGTEDYSEIQPLTMQYSQISFRGVTTCIGVIEDFYCTVPDYGIVFKTNES